MFFNSTAIIHLLRFSFAVSKPEQPPSGVSTEGASTTDQESRKISTKVMKNIIEKLREKVNESKTNQSEGESEMTDSEKEPNQPLQIFFDHIDNFYAFTGEDYSKFNNSISLTQNLSPIPQIIKPRRSMTPPDLSRAPVLDEVTYPGRHCKKSNVFFNFPEYKVEDFSVEKMK